MNYFEWIIKQLFIELGFPIIWRILEISEGVIYLDLIGLGG